MFIETYYDERAVPGNTSEPMIPYPRTVGGRAGGVARIFADEKRDKKTLLTVQYHS